MFNLTHYLLSYGLEKVQNLNLENAQNESVLTPPQKSVPEGRIFEGGFERKWPKKVHNGKFLEMDD